MQWRQVSITLKEQRGGSPFKPKGAAGLANASPATELVITINGFVLYQNDQPVLDEDGLALVHRPNGGHVRVSPEEINR